MSVFRIPEIVGIIIEYVCPSSCYDYRGYVRCEDCDDMVSLMLTSRICFREATRVLYGTRYIDFGTLLKVLDAAKSYDSSSGLSNRFDFYWSKINCVLFSTNYGTSQEFNRIVSYNFQPERVCLESGKRIYQSLMNAQVKEVIIHAPNHRSVFEHLMTNCPNLESLDINISHISSFETKKLLELVTNRKHLRSFGLHHENGHDDENVLQRCKLLKLLSSRRMDKVVLGCGRHLRIAGAVNITQPVYWKALELDRISNEAFIFLAQSAATMATRFNVTVTGTIESPLLFFEEVSPQMRELCLRFAFCHGSNVGKGMERIGKLFPNLSTFRLRVTRDLNAMDIEDSQVEQLVKYLPGLRKLGVKQSSSGNVFTYKSVVAVGQSCRGIEKLELDPLYRSENPKGKYWNDPEFNELPQVLEDIQRSSQLQVEQILFPKLYIFYFNGVPFRDSKVFFNHKLQRMPFFEKHFPRIARTE